MLFMAHHSINKNEIISKGVDEKMSEQDRLNANEDHYNNYKSILVALNSNDVEEAKKICRREMRIISEDMAIENDEEGKIIELPTNHD